MQTYIQEHHCTLNDLQRDYIQEKIETIQRHLGRFSENEATEIKVVMTHEDTKADQDKYLCEVMILFPKKHTVRADARGMTPAEAVDLCEEKLKKQIEKTRTKLIG
jgi:ribosomal subunit interface protein